MRTSPAEPRTLEWLAHTRQLALAVAALVVTATGLTLFFQYQDVKQRNLRELATVARMFGNETAGQLDGVKAVIAAVAESLTAGPAASDPAQAGRLFAESMASLRMVRSLSHVDAEGNVLASSAPANVGARVDLGALGAGPFDTARLGNYVPSRDLADAARPPTGRAPGFLVLSQALPQGRGHLVAALNTDRLATVYGLLEEDAAQRAALLTFNGVVIVAGDATNSEPGQKRADLAPFTRFLPAKESGEYIGPGLDGREQLGAFRSVRGWPLVVVVQSRLRTVVGDWLPSALWVMALAATLLAGLFVTARLFARDMKRQAAAQSVVAASEARQQAILESALDAIVTVDGRGRIRQFNAAAEAMFGYSRAEAEGRPMHELMIPPAARPAHLSGMARVMAGGPSNILRRRVEVQALRRDGSVFPIEIAIVPVETGSGTWFTSTIRDITQRQAVEQAIRQSEARFRGTFEQAVVGMMHQAADRRILRVNNRLCQMLGYTEQELLSISTRDIIHPDDVERGVQGMYQLFAGTRAIWIEEKRYRHKSGRYLWVRLTASIVHIDADNRYMSCVIEDISDYKRAVMELDAARQRELEIGVRIQQSLLVDPAPSNMKGLDFAAYSQPSREIDGDFYDVMDLGQGVVDIVVGDVMGKGVPAALLGAATKMQFARALTRLIANGLPTPAEVVEAVDRAIAPHLHALDAFVTLAYLRIDPRDRTITWVGCGHEEGLLVRPGGAVETLHNQRPPVGVLVGQRFEQTATSFGPGDRLFLCSDGASDAKLPDGTRVGPDRILAMVGEAFAVHPTSAMSLHAVRRQLVQAQASLTDDLTMLVVSSGLSSNTRVISLPVSLDSVDLARKFADAECQAAGMPPEQAGPFTVAVIEAFTNVVRHARGLTPGAPLELSAIREDDDLVMQVRYFGDYFEPPREVPDTDLATFPEGGFGLVIMKEASERLEHSYADGANSLRLIAKVRQR